MQVIGASAAKRYSGKTILSLAVFMWSLSTLVTPFFGGSLYMLVLLRIILGIGEGLGNVLFQISERLLYTNCVLDDL